jgi:hypothetical protein
MFNILFCKQIGIRLSPYYHLDYIIPNKLLFLFFLFCLRRMFNILFCKQIGIRLSPYYHLDYIIPNKLLFLFFLFCLRRMFNILFCKQIGIRLSPYYHLDYIIPNKQLFFISFILSKKNVCPHISLFSLSISIFNISSILLLIQTVLHFKPCIGTPENIS